MKQHLSDTLAEIREAGLYKEERLIESSQSAAISVGGKEVLNFCANNYLGLAELRIYTSSLRLRSATTSRQKTPFSMQPASMPTEAYSNRCSQRRTQ